MASGLKRPRQVNDSIVEDDDSPCLKKSRVRVRTKPNVVFSRRGDRGRPRGSWKGSNNDIRKGGNMEVKKERTVSFQEGPERSPQKFKKRKIKDTSGHESPKKHQGASMFRYRPSPISRHAQGGKESWKNRKSDGVLDTKKKQKLSVGYETPEHLKIKEEDSMLEVEERKERKRQRRRIMTLKTSKGQPLMRGRINLLLEEIKATTLPV